MSFILANPILEGGADITSNQSSRHDAAKDIWVKFSKNIKNYTPNFYFSIKNSESGAYFHYKVSEQIAKNGKVGMKMKRLGKEKINKDALKRFEKAIADSDFDDESSVNISVGGDRKKYKKYDLEDDDSSSSSSSSDSDSDVKFRKRKTKGISLIYSPGIYNVATIGVPIISSTFASNISLLGPFVGIGGVGVGRAVSDLTGDN